MRLIKVLLPLSDPDGKPFPPETYDRVKRSSPNEPAEGIWADGERLDYDQIIFFEVIADAISRRWWKEYRINLEKIFRQDRIIIRAHTIEIL